MKSRVSGWLGPWRASSALSALKWGLPTPSKSGPAATATRLRDFPRNQFYRRIQFLPAMFNRDRREKSGGDDHRAPTSTSARAGGATGRRQDEHGSGETTPDAVVVRLTDDASFQCPFVLMEDAARRRASTRSKRIACARFVEGRLSAGSPITTARLRKSNLTKRSVLPPSEYPRVDRHRTMPSGTRCSK